MSKKLSVIVVSEFGITVSIKAAKDAKTDVPQRLLGTIAAIGREPSGNQQQNKGKGGQTKQQSLPANDQSAGDERTSIVPLLIQLSVTPADFISSLLVLTTSQVDKKGQSPIENSIKLSQLFEDDQPVKYGKFQGDRVDYLVVQRKNTAILWMDSTSGNTKAETRITQLFGMYSKLSSSKDLVKERIALQLLKTFKSLKAYYRSVRTSKSVQPQAPAVWTVDRPDDPLLSESDELGDKFKNSQFQMNKILREKTGEKLEKLNTYREELANSISSEEILDRNDSDNLFIQRIAKLVFAANAFFRKQWLESTYGGFRHQVEKESEVIDKWVKKILVVEKLSSHIYYFDSLIERVASKAQLFKLSELKFMLEVFSQSKQPKSLLKMLGVGNFENESKALFESLAKNIRLNEPETFTYVVNPMEPTKKVLDEDFVRFVNLLCDIDYNIVGILFERILRALEEEPSSETRQFYFAFIQKAIETPFWNDRLSRLYSGARRNAVLNICLFEAKSCKTAAELQSALAGPITLVLSHAKILVESLPTLLKKIGDSLPINDGNEKETGILSLLLSNESLPANTKIELIKSKLLGSIVKPNSHYGKLLLKVFELERPYPCEKKEMEVTWVQFLQALRLEDKQSIFDDLLSPIEDIFRAQLYLSSDSDDSVFHKLTERLHSAVWNSKMDKGMERIPIVFYCRLLERLSKKILESTDIKINDLLELNEQPMISLLAKFASCSVDTIKKKLGDYNREYKEYIKEIEKVKAFLTNLDLREAFLDMKFHSKVLQAIVQLEASMKSLNLKSLPETDNFKEVRKLDTKAMDIFVKLRQHPQYMTILRKSEALSSTEGFSDSVLSARDELLRYLKSMSGEGLTLSLVDIDNYFRNDNDKDLQAFLTDVGLSESECSTMKVWIKRLKALKNLIPMFERDSINNLFKWQSLKGKVESSTLAKNLESMRVALKAKSEDFSNITANDLKVADPTNLCNEPWMKELQPELFYVLSKSEKVFEFLKRDKMKEIIQNLMNECDTQYEDTLKALQTMSIECSILIKENEAATTVQATGDEILKELLGKKDDIQKQLANILQKLNANLGVLRILLTKLTGEFKKKVEDLINGSLFVIQYNPEIDQFELGAEPIAVPEEKADQEMKPKEAVEYNDAKICLENSAHVKDDKKLAYSMYDLKDYFTQARILHAEHTREKDVASREAAANAEGEDQTKMVKELIKNFMNLGDLIEKTLAYIENIRALGAINKTFNENFIQRIHAEREIKDYSALFTRTKHGTRFVFLVNSKREHALTALNRFLDNINIGIAGSLINTVRGGDKQTRSKQLMTYFVGQKLFYLLDMMMLDPDQRTSRECLNTITLLEQANDGNEYDSKSKLSITKLENANLEDRVSKAAQILDDSQLQFGTNGYIEDEERSILSKSLVTTIRVQANSCEVNGFDLLLKIFNSSKDGSQQLLLSDILYCKPTTDQFEINAFLVRCFRDIKRRIYIIINPADLSKSGLNYLLEKIGEYLPSAQTKEKSKDMVNHRLLILNNMKEQESFSNPKLFLPVENDAVKLFKQNIEKANFMDQYHNKLSTIELVTSDLATEGKSYYIASQFKARAEKGEVSKLLELSLSGEINQKAISERLQALSRSSENNLKFDLHIKLDYVERLSQWSHLIDWVLFNFCFLRMHQTDSGIRSYKEQIQNIYIELGNSEADTKLDKCLWTVDLIKSWSQTKEGSKFNLVKKMPSFADKATKIHFNNDPQSDEQVVAKYLKEFKTQEFVVNSSTSSTIVPVGEYEELLKNAFLEVYTSNDDAQKITFGSFRFWLKAIARLKRGLDEWISRTQADPNAEWKCQFIETSQEIKSAAEKLLKLQDNKATWKQDQVMKIVYPENEGAVKNQAEQAKIENLNHSIVEGIEKKIKETNWDTSEIYLPIISQKSFLPVFSKSEAFTGRELVVPELKNDEETQLTIQQRFATKVLSSSIANDFDQLAGQGENNASLEYAYRLALMLSDARDKNMIKAKYTAISTAIQEFSDQKEDIERTINRKGFSITEEVFHKLVLMYFKAELKSPIIIMGESGCGKTYLTQFLVKSLLNDKLMMETLHSGYPEKRLIVFILNAIKEAQKLKTEGKKLWIFFDEFNTTAIQSMIADTILDRTCPKLGSISEQEFNDITHAIGIQDLAHDELTKLEAEGIQDNMIFIACCNPFCIKLKKSTADIGLVPNEKSSMLSHIVHPIPKRLLAQVWDFGMLSDKTESTHINNQVQNQDFFITDETGVEPTPEKRKEIGRSRDDYRIKKNSQFALLAKNCHKIVRSAEERSGVSLRDTHRLYTFFRWFSKQFRKFKVYLEKQRAYDPKCPKLWMLSNPQLMDIGAAVCTMILCYGLRLNGQAASEELYDCISNWANHISKLRLIDRKTEIETALQQVAEVFLYAKRSFMPPDIALNRPLLENFITLLACYAVKIPMIIIGAPGTSKTLSTSLFLSFLENRHENDELYDELPDANSIYYSGSQTSTAEAVERVFKKAEFQYEQEVKRFNDAKAKEGQTTTRKDQMKTQIIFFDELGLAELSPHNPLKVMHSYLEKNIGKIMFIGISNWKPDQSKLNRMISLARPDLEESDLLSIFNAPIDELNESSSSQKKKFVRDMIDCLPAAYLKFRKWQKSLSAHKDCYHSNFHGSRDIYGAYNVFKYKIKNEFARQIGRHGIQKEAFRILSHSIDRNLNGELYIFGPEDLDTKTFVFPEDQDDVSIKVFFEENLLKNSSFKREEHEVIRLDALEDVYHQKKSVQRKNVICLTSSEVMKMLFLQQLHSRSVENINALISDFFKDRPVITLLMESIKSDKSRFCMVRTESLIIEDIFIDQLKSSMSNSNLLIDWRTSEGSQVDDRLTLFKNYVTKGYTVVMKNQDDLYGALYELFNQKYTENNGKKTCNLYDGEMRHRVEVHKDFKCIVILPASMTDRRSKDLEKKQPAPFLNRFEKFYLHMESVIPKQDLDLVVKMHEVACKIANGNTLNLIGLNLDLITSLVIQNGKRSSLTKNDMKTKLLQLATANTILTSAENITKTDFGSIIRAKTENKNDDKREDKHEDKREEFTFASVLESLSKGKEESVSKLILLTFSKPAEIQADLLRPYRVILVSTINWKDVRLNKGFMEVQEGSTEKISLVMIFENYNDLEHLYNLRNLVDKMTNLKMVLFLVHMSKYSFERKKLRENNGISFYNGWDVRVIDKLDNSFSYINLIKVRDRNLLNEILKNPREEQEDDKANEVDFEPVTSEVVRLIIKTKWDQVIKETEKFASNETDVSRIYSMLSDADTCKLVMPAIKHYLNKYINESLPESPTITITITKAVKDTVGNNADSNDNENYKEVAQMLSLAMTTTFGKEISTFFNKLNIASHNFYTRLIGIRDCSSLAYNHAECVRQACTLSSTKGDLRVKVLPSKIKCYYSPFTAEDLQLMDSLYDQYTPLDEQITFKRTNLALLLKEYSRLQELIKSGKQNPGQKIEEIVSKGAEDNRKIIEGLEQGIKREEISIRLTAEDIENRLIRADKDEGDAQELPALSFKDVIQQIINQDGAEVTRLVADVLKFIFEKMNISYFGENNKLPYLEGFIRLCKEWVGNIETYEDLNQKSQFVKLLSVALELCYCFESTVRGFFELLHRGQTTDIVLRYIEAIVGVKETSKNVLINMKVLEALQQVIAVHSIKVGIIESKESLDLIRRTINMSNVFRNEYREVVNLIFCMIGNISDKFSQEKQLSELQQLNLHKEESQILPSLLQLGNRVFVQFLASRAQPPKISKEFSENMLKIWQEETCHWTQHFVRVWSGHQDSFDMLINEQYYQLYNVFTEEEMLLIMMGVSATVDSILGRAINSENIICMIDKVDLQGKAIISLHELVKKWASPSKKSTLHQLLLKALHENMVSSAFKSSIDPKRRPNVYSFESMKRIMDAFCNWDMPTKHSTTLPSDKPSEPQINLKLLVASACYWVTLSDPRFDSVHGHTELDKLNDLYETFLKDRDPNNMLNAKNSFPFFCLMQKAMSQDNDITKVASKMHLAQALEEGMNDKLDYTRLGILDDKLVSEYSEVSEALESCAVEAANSGQATKLVKLINDSCSTPTKVYFIGLMVINEFLTVGCTQARIESYTKAFTTARGTIGVSETLPSKICLFVLNLLGLPYTKRAVKLIGEENAEVEFKIKKAMSHLALMVLVFPKSALKYKGNEWKNWKDGVTQENLYLKICLESKLKRSAFAFNDTLLVRMPQLASGWWPWTSLKKNIALYMCNCGFSYNYDNCGYGEIKTLLVCLYCGKQIGPMSHGMAMLNSNYKKVEPPEETNLANYQIKLQDAINLIKSMYEANTNIYVGHCEFDDQNPTFSIQQLINIPLSEYLKKSSTKNGKFDDKLVDEIYRNNYVKHLLDHLYLSALPMLLEPADLPKYKEAVEKSLKYQPPTVNGEKKLLDQTPSDAIKTGPIDDYFTMHIASDLKNLKMILQLDTPVDALEWLLALEANFFDAIVKAKLPDANSELLIEARSFTNPREIIKQHADQVNKLLNNDSNSLPARIRALLKKHRLQSEICKDDVEKKHLLLYESLRINKTYSFMLVQNEFNSRQGSWLPLLNKCNKYRELLAIFPKMMGTLMDLIRHVQLNYSGIISFQEAYECKFMGNTYIKDDRLRSLYRKFQTVWNEVRLGNFADKFSEVFELAFMCQNGMNFDDFFPKLLNDEEVRLSYFTMLDTDSEYAEKETIIMSALVRTLVEKVHNSIINDANFLIHQQQELRDNQQKRDEIAEKKNQAANPQNNSQQKPGAPQNNQKKISQALIPIKITDAFEKDFTCLRLDFDQMLMDHSSTNPKPNSASPFLLDIFTLQTNCANEVGRNEISAESKDIFKFKFIEGVGADHRQDVINRLKKVQEVQLIPSIEKKLRSKKYSEETEIMSLMRLIYRVCDYLFVSVSLENDSTVTLQEKLKDEAAFNEAMETQKLELLNELVKLEFDPNEIQIGMLKPIYDYVSKMHFDLYLSKFNVRLDREDELKITNMYKTAGNDMKELINKAVEALLLGIKELYKTDALAVTSQIPDYYGNDVNDELILAYFSKVRLGHYLHLREIIPNS